MASLISSIQDYRVSSVLNNDRKVYGKKFLFDGKDETCWNSDQGSPQWILLHFKCPTTITQLRLQFQGGFAGKDCELQTVDLDSSSGHGHSHSEGALQSKPKESSSSKFQFSPDDSNSYQEFSVNGPELTSTAFRLTFNTSTDFYGRIILYNFDIIGSSRD